MTRITDHSRRRFLQLAARSAAASAALSIFPPSIRKALALPAATRAGTLADVRHVIILMQENRSFDHYFGTLRGVRGFGDRHPIPLASSKPVWFQSDGEKDIPPFRLDTRTTSALRTPGTPHAFDDAQAAWGQGTLSQWPKFKKSVSMGHYRREDIPFQFALADAFTICDAHHCSVTTGTDPNRIVFWSGSNFDPVHRARGENCTDADAEVNNLRCQIEGQHPDPGYSYQGSAFNWPTLPELLGAAGISWRIYQDPNDNWTGLMHGGLAFESFRTATPGSSIYDNGMTPWSLDAFAADVQRGSLPSVSWILPTKLASEHPWASSSLQGADFTSRVIDALTANPDVWGETVLFLTFDENDGLFDHVPPPAPPSHNLDGSLAGKATLDLRGQYFFDPERKYLHPDDQISGSLRPYGLGARVPLYVISPWSRGGWVNSQVFDHTSVGRFLEKRFGITVPAISPWHRAVCGDLTSAFDFENPNEAAFPAMPKIVDMAGALAAAAQRPKPDAPEVHEALFQEPGVRQSRATPYELHVEARFQRHDDAITLVFRNTGAMGAVFHVYDKLHLDRIPRRYTVEAGKSLDDQWSLGADDGRYHLWVYGPNGFVREFVGRGAASRLEIGLRYRAADREIELVARNAGPRVADLEIQFNAYRNDGPWILRLERGRTVTRTFSLVASHCWYDFTASHGDVRYRFAGRLETGAPGFTDPAIGV
ncbi:MAG: phospholipase C, phosphocholine-specific [Nibricoccus sp.]